MKLGIYSYSTTIVLLLLFGYKSSPSSWLEDAGQSFSLPDYLDCSSELNESFLDDGNTLSFDDTDLAVSRCREKEIYFASEILETNSCIPREGFFEEWHCLVLDQRASLCPSANPFQLTVLVAVDNISLDCNHQAIDHGFKDETDKKNTAIRFPRNRGVSGVSIRNCTIQNTGFGAVEIRRDFRGADHSVRTDGHKNITLDSITAINNKLALFIGDRSENIIVRNSWFISSRQMPIYLEANSSGSIIENNTFVGSLDREAIAIDSSSNNILRHNVFYSNHGGAILVYHNCGELLGSVCPIERSGAYNNHINKNTFYENQFTIIGSRQGRFYNSDWCDDLSGESGCGMDDSRQNRIRENLFYVGNRQISLSIQDGDNTVSSNKFINSNDENSAKPALRLSTGNWDSEQCDAQEYPNLDMTGNKIINNEFIGCSQNQDCQIQNLLYDITSVTFDNNIFTTIEPSEKFPLSLELLMSFL